MKYSYIKEPLLKKIIKKRLGLNEETFSFYLEWGLIKKSSKKGKYLYALEMEHDMILERDTVYKYHFEDDFEEELRIFAETVKHTSKCQTWSKEELYTLQDELIKTKNPKQRKLIESRIKEIKEVLKIA